MLSQSGSLDALNFFMTWFKVSQSRGAHERMVVDESTIIIKRQSHKDEPYLSFFKNIFRKYYEFI